jgi:predicted nuclease of predicted toxin-antitoxin system
LKFIVDTQLPPLLAEVLKSKGYDIIHTTNFSKGHLLNDSEIRTIAVEEKRIIITKDKDFFDYYLLKGAPPKILLIEIGNSKNKELLDIVRQNFSTIVELFDNSSLVVMQKNNLYTY